MSFILSESGKGCTGWIDYDQGVLPTLSVKDRIEYVKHRFELVFFSSMEQIYLERSPHHNVVNGPHGSFAIKRGGMANLGGERLSELPDGPIEIDTEWRYEDLKRGFDQYIHDLRQGNDQTLVDHFNARFQAVYVGGRV